MANDLAIIERRLEKEIRIEDYHNNYSLQTAMQAVAAIFSENNNFNRCSIESKYKAVLSMVVQGLNPLKGQCSFVPYGNQLQLLRDYSGSIMVAKNSDKRIVAINSKVVRDGDVFEFEIKNGLYTFTKHKPTIKSLNGEIVAAYAVAVSVSAEVVDSDIMSVEDIHRTWKNQGLKYKGEPVVRQDGSIHPGSNHGRWPEKMAIKTVVHRLCRSIIKSSNNDQIADLADDEIIITEAEPETVDFDQPAPQQPQEPEEPPCNPEQAKQICEMWKQIAPESNVVDNISAHLNRQVKRLREVTQIEAAQYLNVLAARLEATKEKESEPPAEDDMPDWA